MFAGLPRSAVVLGLAGLLPQGAALVIALTDHGAHYFAIAAGCCYAAAILSFLGGVWWMAGLLAPERPDAIFVVAVLPSLAAWAALLPWCVGWSWPGPSLAGLGLALLASPIFDRALARRIALPQGWLRLRFTLAVGLGLLTLALAAA